jgi:IS605 OrfB family transposase
MTAVTKTLELKLVDPNAHKRQKLRETRDAYRRALATAFDAGCTTQAAANDVVVEYDLSGYAKNALKRYVPQLATTYDADELHDEHPVRFTNDGVQLDHKPQNAVEWYVKIPHHEDYNLWMPAQPNPEQRDWMEALNAGDARMGECRLLDCDGDWFLHITVERDVEDRSSARASADERTPVGVDIGDAALCTVCHRDERGIPTTPELWADDGSEVRRLRKTYFTATRRLQRRGSDRIAEEYGDALWGRIDHILHRVSREVVEYAAAIDTPVLVLEDLTHIRESMDYGEWMNRRLHGWGFAKLHAQIRYKAAERGIPVETVNPHDTSTECHACGEAGHRPEQATFRCSNADCWVSEYQADVNAALNIADRYSTGESQPRTSPTTDEKAAGDDSGGDGACLTAPQDTRAEGGTHPATRGTNAS